MPFVQAKCPNCGGMLAVDDSKKAAICQFCGDAFVVEEAVNNYNTYNITNNTTNQNFGEGSVVNIYEDKTKDFVIEVGVLKEYKGASVDVVIPDGVIEIGERCFKGSKIKSVVIPDSVTKIDYCAFWGCGNLTSITIPDSVTTIGNSAFARCSALSSISIPNSVKCIGKYTFQGCLELTSIEMPDSLTSIGEYAFSICPKLTSIEIPKSVTNIGEKAFLGTPWYAKICAKEEAERQAKIQTEAAEKQKIIAERKDKGLCQHCGGVFKKGLFGTKCVECGKPKDY